MLAVLPVGTVVLIEHVFLLGCLLYRYVVPGAVAKYTYLHILQRSTRRLSYNINIVQTSEVYTCQLATAQCTSISLLCLAPNYVPTGMCDDQFKDMLFHCGYRYSTNVRLRLSLLG